MLQKYAGYKYSSQGVKSSQAHTAAIAMFTGYAFILDQSLTHLHSPKVPAAGPQQHAS